MSARSPTRTSEDVDRIPYDGKRHEIVSGRYFTSDVPPMAHQEILGAILIFLGTEVYVPRLGTVLPGILNVRFSVHDQVQPDVIVIDPSEIFANLDR